MQPNGPGIADPCSVSERKAGGRLVTDVAQRTIAVTQAPRDDEIRLRVLSLPQRFRTDAANGLRAEWELSVDDETYTISVAKKSCRVRPGSSASAVARITADRDTWLAIDDGRVTGIDAFLSSRLTLRGNLDLAARLQSLFEPHARPRGPLDLEQLDVKAGDVNLSTYVVGEGPPVIALHGLGGTKISMLPIVSALAPYHRLIIPDLPGHGESDKPVSTQYTPRNYARIVRKLMDAFDVDRAIVIGNSLGGRVALELGIRSPDRVRALGLLAPAVPGFRVRYIMGFTRVIPTEVGAVPFPLRERWMKAAVRRLLGDPSKLPESAYQASAEEFIRIYRSPQARMAFFDSLRHLLTEPPKPFWAHMRRVRVPVQIVWGTSDRLVPVRLAPKLAGELPDAQLLVLPRVGHVPQFEATEQTTKALTTFIAGLEG
jgi:pimeloyl-ACP methyl ester carboxylesterase/putative sterol carrier protein